MRPARAVSPRCVECFTEFTTEDTEGTENAEEGKLSFREVAAADFCAQAAACELHVNLVADGHLIRGAHQVSCRIRTDRVAPLEDAQRAALLELQPEALEPLHLADQEPLDSHPQLGGALHEPQAQSANPRAQIERRDTRSSDRVPAAKPLQSPLQRNA